jgi:hypothetical protein
MGDVAVLNEVMSALKPSYSQDALRSVEQALHSTTIDDERAAEAVCRALTSMRAHDAAGLIAGKWPEIPKNLRYVFQRLEWCGRKRGRDIHGALVMAMRLMNVDAEAAAFFIDHVLSRHREHPTEHKDIADAIRRTWLISTGKPSRLGVNFLQAEHLRPEWRWPLAKLIVDAAIDGSTPDKILAAQLRPELAAWIESLAALADVAGDRSALLEQKSRLTGTPLLPPKPTAQTSQGSSERRDETTSTPKDSLPSAHVPPGRASLFSQVATAIKLLNDTWKDAHKELERIEHQSPSRQTQRELDDAKARVAELDARVSQLERDLAAERGQKRESESRAAASAEKLEQAQDQVARLQSELEKSTSTIAELRKDLDVLQGKYDVEKDAHVKNLDLERAAERRVMGEQIASAIADDMQTLREAALHPEEPGKAKFVLTVAQDMLRRLGQHGVPLQK